MGPERDRTPGFSEAQPRVSREFGCGVVLSPDDAESVARWLLEQVEILRGSEED